jgi:hypothetical protein
MARSRKKTPISGVTCSTSNKEFKQQEHRRERRIVHQKLLMEHYEDLPHIKQFGNEWASPRDGKMWFGDLKDRVQAQWCLPGCFTADDQHEWAEYYKELMRK